MKLPTRRGTSQEAGTMPSERDSFWLTRHARTILFFTVVLAAAGVYLALSIPISVFPSTNFPRVVIGIDNGVMPVEQMEVTITRPIENAINSVPGLQTVRSTTSRGSAEVSLFFDWNVDMYRTLQLVDAALSRVQQALPPTVQLRSQRLTFATFPILGYSLTSDTISQTDLWQIATYQLRPALNRLNGVSTVIVQGGQVPEFGVVPDPAKLANSGVTVPDLLAAIQQTNFVDSPGLYEANHQLVLGLIGAQSQNSANLANIAVKTTPGGVPVRISDVATVSPSTQPLYTVVSANGKPAVLLNISRQPISNTVQVADEVTAEMAALEKKLPPGIHVEPFYDQSELVRASISSVRDAILIGIILASLVIVIFLRDWRASLVAGLVIPVTVAITFVFIKVFGLSFDLMTLGGLAAAVGLVIDDAIVMVENIVLHRESGEGRIDAVRKALAEITVPLFFCTVTPVVVFLPLISVTGVTGSFFRALAITMAVSLITSLALALSWTPALSLLMLRSPKHAGSAGEFSRTETHPATESTHFEDDQPEVLRLAKQEEHALKGAMKHIVNFYERVLRVCLERPLWVAAACVVLLLGTYFSYKGLGSDLLPAMDEGGFVLDYIMPAGSSLSETNRVLQHVETILQQTPEVANVSRRTGLQMGLAAVTEANTGDMTVRLNSKRSRGIDEVMADIRERINASEPQLSVEFIQVLQDMIGDLSNSPEPVQIKLFSTNDALLNQLGPQVADAIKTVPGVVDVLNGVENTISGPSTTFQIDPALASRMGFTSQELAMDAAAIVEGEPATTPVIQNGRAYTVRVRYGEEHRASLDAIKNTMLNSSTGHLATLGSMTDVQQNAGQTEIRRENLQRDVVVTGRLEGTNLGGAIKLVQAKVNSLHLPPTVRVEYGGTYQEQQTSFAELRKVLLLALGLVFGVLLTEFRNFSAPIAILTSSVLSSAGVILALLITGTTFNVASFMGLIMVIGIVAKNGILLLDADEKFRDAGVAPEQAMLLAGRRRLRPILMTALAAITGMFPLALALGAGSQMLQPLAIAVIGGLLISMLLSLVVTPVIYFRLTAKSRRSVPVAVAQ